MNFASDNQSGASQQVIDSMLEANQGFTHGYGDDEWTQKAVTELKRVFECDLEAYFVSTGTAANCLALSCLTHPWETILSHHSAHIILDESTAPEFFTGGARLTALGQGRGKLSPEDIEHYLETAGDTVPHNSLASTISISQVSENGLVYSPEEVKALSALCKEKNLKFHMDGARFANALASLKCTPAELTWKSGVDVLCLGATKCGALCAEAVIFFDTSLAATFSHRRKRAGQLLSKGRLLGAQFVGWLHNDHWLELAQHANTQAAQFADTLSTFNEIRFAWPVQANEIFVIMPKDLSLTLEQAGAEFYQWDSRALSGDDALGNEEIYVRLVTSFLTTDQHRDEFCKLISDFLKGAE